MNNFEFTKSIGEREMDAQQTMQQLTYGNRKIVFWSWGVSKRLNFNNKVLMLQVNGRLHKGKIYIALAWDDTYTVYQTTNQNRVIKKSEMVYFDQLTEVIDRMVETPLK